MSKKLYIIRSIKITALLAVLIFESITATVMAVDIDFYQSNDIFYYAPGNGNNTCSTRPGSSAGDGATSTGNGANDNKDYKSRQIISDRNLEQIKEYQPVYEKAAAETDIPWQVFATLHLKELALVKANPSNGQGIYRDSEGTGGPYPRGSVSDAEFQRQTTQAGTRIKEMVGDKIDLVKKGDIDAIKALFFTFDGAYTSYIKQADELGYGSDKGAEGSPYVMSKADEKRDPEVNTTTWGERRQGSTQLRYPANNEYGAYLIYGALVGTPSTTTPASDNRPDSSADVGSNTNSDNRPDSSADVGSDPETRDDTETSSAPNPSPSSNGCTNGGSVDSRFDGQSWPTSGPNSMVVYYQDEEPWASARFGPHDIKGWGCGPTSTAMAIATLNKDSSINPETMAKDFYDNGYLADSGTSWGAWDSNNAIAKKYGVTFIDIGTDMAKAAEAVKRGSFVVMSANGCPFACAGGHILLFRGVTTSGKFLVADPNKNWAGEGNSNKTMNNEGYDVPSAAGSGIRNMWEIRKT